MNSYITLACLLAVVGLSYAVPSGYGYGYGLQPVLAFPSAISTASVVRAAPIKVIKPALAPVITAPIAAAPIGYGWGGLGWGGLGWDGHGLEGWSGWNNYGLGKHMMG